MSDAELADHAWWSWFWTLSEHWAFFAVILALGIELVALKLGEPHKKAVDDAKDLKVAELSKETVRLSGDLEKSRTATAAAQLELETVKKQVGPRTLDGALFQKLLATQPKPSGVRILFSEQAADGPILAMQTLYILKAVNWDPEMPEMISREAPLLKNIPMMWTGGANSWVTIFVPPWPFNPRTDVRLKAVMDSFSQLGSMSSMQDDTVPQDHVWVVIRPKL